MGKPPWSTSCCPSPEHSMNALPPLNASWIPMIWNASAASRFCPRTPPSSGGTTASILWTHPVTLISAAKWNACCPWSIRYCYWSMRWKAPCHRPVSSHRKHCSRDCARLLSSTRLTGPAHVRTGCSTRPLTCSTASAPATNNWISR